MINEGSLVQFVGFFRQSDYRFARDRGIRDFPERNVPYEVDYVILLSIKGDPRVHIALVEFPIFTKQRIFFDVKYFIEIKEDFDIHSFKRNFR